MIEKSPLDVGLQFVIFKNTLRANAYSELVFNSLKGRLSLIAQIIIR